MYRFLPLFCMLLPSLLAGPAGAQSVGIGGAAYGVVHSEEGAPIPSALISLRRSADTVQVANSTTDSTGAFRFGGVAAGTYLVEVRRLGYKPVTRDGIAVTDSANVVNLGIIVMTPAATALDSVVVTSARPAISVLPDRNVYSTSNMPVAAGGTATDVLRTIPELEVSVEGSVTTRGATPQIHINGRPAPMQGEALDRYLQQLPADRIDRIEVISNPSARYESAGEGGIVNIVMKRGTSLGISGSLSVNAGTRNQRGGSGSINYQLGRLSLFGSGSATFSGNRTENSDLRQNLTVQPMTFIQQDSRNRNSGSSGNLNLGAEVKVRTDGTFWVDASAGRNASDINALAAYTHLDYLRIPTQRYDRVNDTELRGRFGSYGMGFHNASKSGGSVLSLELRRNLNDDDQATGSAKNWLDLTGVALDLPPELTIAGQGQDQRGTSAEANLTVPWGEAGQLETGFRGSVRKTGDNFNMWLDASGDPSGWDDAVGDFRQRERIDAAFVNVTQQIGRVSIQAGLRGQRSEMRRTLALTGETFDLSYSNLFPSATISTELGTGGQLSLSYSKRVDAPWGAIVNPATPILDPLNRRIGNPYLMPRFTHSFNLSLTRTGRLGLLQLSPYYRRTVDGWDQVRTVDESGVSTVTWQNLATISSYGGSLSASLTPVGRLGGFVNVSAYHEVRDGSNLRADFSGSSTQVSVISTASIRATAGNSLQASMTYLPARTLPQGRISPMVFSTLTMRQQLWRKRGAISISVTDPFELQRFTFTTRDQSHVQTGSSTFSARRAALSISYSFGKPGQRSTRKKPEDNQQEPAAPVIR